MAQCIAVSDIITHHTNVYAIIICAYKCEYITLSLATGRGATGDEFKPNIAHGDNNSVTRLFII